jgi:hypothetical protein
VVWSQQKIFDFVNRQLNELAYQSHVQGGTMVPSQINILITCVLTIVFWEVLQKFKVPSRQRRFFTFFVISLFTYYSLILIISMTTPPHSIDYAGSKLGLVLVSLFLPFGIIGFSLLLKKFFEQKSFAWIYSFAVVIFLLTAGPPTSPTSPVWTQLGFPGPVNARANDLSDSYWGSALIEKIESNPDKRILCFAHNTLIADPMDISICTRFAAGIQGFDKEMIAEFWRQVNLNVASIEDFRVRTDEQFFKQYDFLIIDELLPQSPEVKINYLSEIITSK